MLIFIEPTILVTLDGTVVVFSAPSMFVFLSWHVKRKKIDTWREGAQGTAQGVPT